MLPKSLAIFAIFASIFMPMATAEEKKGETQEVAVFGTVNQLTAPKYPDPILLTEDGAFYILPDEQGEKYLNQNVKITGTGIKKGSISGVGNNKIELIQIVKIKSIAQISNTATNRGNDKESDERDPYLFTGGWDPNAELHHDRGLGPIGATGYRPMVKRPQKKAEDGDREIPFTELRVRKVDEGGPSQGKLQECDIILGVVEPRIAGKTGDGRFKADAYEELTAAIIEAERNNAPNRIVLRVLRPETVLRPVTVFSKINGVRRELVKPIVGSTIDVAIDVKPLGAYSATTPWECEKTKNLIDRCAESLMKSDLGGSFGGILGALGLLATGEEKYLPAVQKLAYQLLPLGERLRLSVEPNAPSKETAVDSEDDGVADALPEEKRNPTQGKPT